jgi:hypothetical protein
MSEGTVQAAAAVPKKKKIALPAYFDAGMVAVFNEAARRDVGYAHYWIKAEANNRQVRRSMGWTPCEDAALLKSLGLGDLIEADGRAHFMDTELWRMPLEMQEAIHTAQGERLAAQSDAVRKSLDAMGEEAKGRSKGAIMPYTGTGDNRDLITRERVAPPVTPKAK